MPDEKPDSPVARRWLLGSIAFFALVMLVVYIMSLLPDREGPNGEDHADGVVETYNPALETDVPVEPGALVLSDYRYDPGTRVIEGSVMNNGATPVVNVQVGFDLLRADSSVVGTVRDTTRQLEAGETWLFRIPVVGQEAVSSVRPSGLSGGQRDTRAPQPNAPAGEIGDTRNTIAPGDGSR